jgi:hypothetical protein
MIARLNRIGERCRSELRAMRALTRVLFVASRGLYRSWGAQDPAAHPEFRRARQAAYCQLWAKLENVYWKLRERNGDALTLRALLRDVNVFLAENLIYIRQADRELLSQYILSLQRLRAASHPMNENFPIAAWEGICGRVPNPAVPIEGDIEETVSLRNRVLLQLRLALPSN